MRDSTIWWLVGWGIFLLAGVAIRAGTDDLKIASLYIVTAIVLGTSAILKALGK